MTLKEYLKDSRKKANLTQSEAAKALVVSVTTIQNWESGVCTPQKSLWDSVVAVYSLDRTRFISLISDTQSEEEAEGVEDDFPDFLFENPEQIRKLVLTPDEQELFMILNLIYVDKDIIQIPEYFLAKNGAAYTKKLKNNLAEKINNTYCYIMRDGQQYKDKEDKYGKYIDNIDYITNTIHFSDGSSTGPFIKAKLLCKNGDFIENEIMYVDSAIEAELQIENIESKFLYKQISDNPDKIYNIFKEKPDNLYRLAKTKNNSLDKIIEALKNTNKEKTKISTKITKEIECDENNCFYEYEEDYWTSRNTTKTIKNAFTELIESGLDDRIDINKAYTTSYRGGEIEYYSYNQIKSKYPKYISLTLENDGHYEEAYRKYRENLKAYAEDPENNELPKEPENGMYVYLEITEDGKQLLDWYNKNIEGTENA